MTSHEPSFMDQYWSGHVCADQIDDYIDTWHAMPGPFGPKLHTFLGLTWDQYRRWGTTGELPSAPASDQEPA